MKKQGFVFMESVIVLMVVALALTMLISSYSLITRKTNEKEYYDRSSDKYLLYSITNIGVNDECNYNLANSCGYEGINLQADEKNCNNTRIGKLLYNCGQTFKDMNIRHIYVVDDIKKELSQDDAVEKYDNGTIEYMKTLKKCNDTDSNTCNEPISYMIGVFYRSGNYYYSSIKIDAITGECEEGYYLSSVTKKCEKIEYVIKFDKQDGTGGTNSIKISTGSKPGNISVPSKEKYAFLGYFTKENGEGDQYYDSNGKALMVFNQSQNITLYAHWTEARLAGAGTETDPYKIQYIEDLVDLSKNVDNGETYAGKYFIVTKNLDFKNPDSYKNSERTDYGDINGINGSEPLMTELTTGTGFNPIGKYSTPFSGTLDGRNHRINNLYIYNNKESGGEVYSFIAFLKDGEVKNLTMQGEITSDAKVPLGGIVGRIENSTIDNSVNEIAVTEKVNGYALGGVVGWSTGDATIKNSTNNANMAGGHYTGGIIAGNQGGTLTIENCKNYGTLTNESGIHIGGILSIESGNVKKTIIRNSTNYGEIQGKTTTSATLYLGGLVGKNIKELEIIDSNNEGKITINSNGGFNAGGLIGYVGGKANINNSHNKNTITSNKTDNIGGRNIGGLVGSFISTQTSIITNSSNEKTGVISGGDRTGGLVGNCEAGLIMNNCNNLANISSGDTWSSFIDIGGLFGDTNGWSTKHDDIIILNSYNKGNMNVSIDNNGSSIGGLIGEQIHSNPSNVTDTSTNTKIINSYNQGNITMNGNTTGSLNANGIMGIQEKSIVLNNVYNIGILNSTKTNNVIANNNSNVTTNYKNVYYLSSLSGTKPTDTTNVIGKSESEMKNQTFVNTLNTNKNGIKLTEIDSRLSGYTLCNWKLGTSGYPELSC